MTYRLKPAERPTAATVTVRTISQPLAQYAVWQYEGTGYNKVFRDVVWSHDEYGAAEVARTRFGAGRYQIREGPNRNGRELLRYA